jgi:hypothetical protein
MDVFSTELGIRLSFVKTSEFRGVGGLNPPPLGTPLPLRKMNRLVQLGKQSPLVKDGLLNVKANGKYSNHITSSG